MKRLLLVGLFGILAGCSAQKHWVAEGGSYGIVRLAYHHHWLERPWAEEEEANQLAQKRCAAWGFQGVEPFGVEAKRCIQMASNGCDVWQVSREWQCTGKSANPPGGPTAER